MSSPSDREKAAPEAPRRRLVPMLSLVLWTAVIAFQVGGFVSSPSAMNGIVLAAFLLLCLAVNAQLFLVRWMGQRNWHRVMSKMHRSSYLSETHNLPNRNYLLAELRREMPRARATHTPFTLVLVSMDTLTDIRERRGNAFGERSSVALADTLRRITRNADFIAHLQDAQFCVMLNECSAEQAWLYLRMVPGSVPVSDGRNMYDVPVSARMMQYDLEALYATDVLRDVEEAKPLRRREEPRPGVQAA
ncbi:MAG: diguanylate cyclase [Dehalococcoidia bacterium]